MQNLEEILVKLGSIAERRSHLLSAEAKLWIEVQHLCLGAVPVAPAREPRGFTPVGDGRNEGNLLLSTSHAAEFLNLSSSTLSKWRLSGKGPAFVKLGRRVCYRRSALEKFVTARVYPNTAAYK